MPKLLQCFLMLCLAWPAAAQEVVRGLKTELIEEVESTIYRRYPSVLVPADLSTLGFEVSGKLETVSIDIGQRVQEGDLLASLDETTFQLEVQRAQAAFEQADADARNTADNLTRQETLLKNGTTTRVNVDNARTSATAARAQRDQAESSLKTAQENLTKTRLLAPFDGVINTVDVQSFGTVSPGMPVATLYKSDSFEVQFTVNFDVVNLLALGKSAEVRLADRPSTLLKGTITEIGARADQVSAFPVVITVDNAPADVRAGMAVEITLDFSLVDAPGYLIPLSSLVDDRVSPTSENQLDPVSAQIYLFDESSSTVVRHDIQVLGVRQNRLLVVDGLKPGDRVAVAGVPFLREGMKVKLLADK